MSKQAHHLWLPILTKLTRLVSTLILFFYLFVSFTGRRWILWSFIFLLESNLSCHVKEISVNRVIVPLATFMTLSDSRRTVYIRIWFRAKAYFLQCLPRWFVVPFLKAAGQFQWWRGQASEGVTIGLRRKLIASSTSFLSTTAVASETIGDFTSLI